MKAFHISIAFSLDKERVAIWGWSYGGFVTASVLAMDAEKNNIFKVKILFKVKIRFSM